MYVYPFHHLGQYGPYVVTTFHLSATQTPVVRFLPCTVGLVWLNQAFVTANPAKRWSFFWLRSEHRCIITFPYWSLASDSNGDCPAPKAGDLPISPTREIKLYFFKHICIWWGVQVTILASLDAGFTDRLASLAEYHLKNDQYKNKKPGYASAIRVFLNSNLPITQDIPTYIPFRIACCQHKGWAERVADNHHPVETGTVEHYQTQHGTTANHDLLSVAL